MCGPEEGGGKSEDDWTPLRFLEALSLGPEEDKMLPAQCDEDWAQPGEMTTEEVPAFWLGLCWQAGGRRVNVAFPSNLWPRREDLTVCREDPAASAMCR